MNQRKRASRLCAVFLTALVLMSILSGCGVSRITKQTDTVTYGIDVAKYQGTIDWSQVAEFGVDFAMVRLGYRTITDGIIAADSNARYNLQEASRAGISLGAYFFSTAVTVEEAVEEAKWTANLLRGYAITYPVAYDCEGYDDPESRQYGMTKEERTDIALAFLKTIEKLGYEGMFYASKNQMISDTKWETSRISKRYKIWVAQYPDAPYPMTPQSSYPDEHHMWQYSKSGTVPGITQPVDLDIAYFGYDGIEPAKDKQPPETVGPDVEALMDFTQVSETVTAKKETNLRSIPSQEESSQVLYTLKNGELAQRIAVSSSGWSKVIFNGETYYAVTSYLTTDLTGDSAAQTEGEDSGGIQTQFTKVEEQVTAKDYVNLRLLPSVEDEGAQIIGQLHNGEVAKRVGISDNGWSKLIYKETTCYAVSSYLMIAEGTPEEGEVPKETGSGIQTQFQEVNEQVTAKLEVNLRTMPSVEHPDSQVIVTIHNGDVVTRTGINLDVGWSRVDYNGQTLYCVSSYLTLAQ